MILIFMLYYFCLGSDYVILSGNFGFKSNFNKSFFINPGLHHQTLHKILLTANRAISKNYFLY